MLELQTEVWLKCLSFHFLLHVWKSC